MYIAEFNNTIDESGLCRLDILRLMLEHEDPALIFNMVIDKASDETLCQCIQNTLDYGYVIDAIAQHEMVKEGTVNESVLHSINEWSGNKFNKGYNDTKIANSTGKDSLKKLIGKSGDSTDITKTDWKRVGEIIADMEGYNKRDYVGMMNFLSTSCWMQKYLVNKLGNEYRRQAKRTFNPKKEVKPKPEKKQTVEAKPFKAVSPSKKQGKETANDKDVVPELQLAHRIEFFDDSVDVLTEDNVTSFIQPSRPDIQIPAETIGGGQSETRTKIKKAIGYLNMEDFVKVIASVLSRLSDLDIANIDNDIADYDHSLLDREPSDMDFNDMLKLNGIPDPEVPVPSITERKGNSYDSATKAAIRIERDNGKGGLKELVGKSKGDDLDVGDLGSIASSIKSMDEDERGYYIGLVSFMGSSCPIFNAIVSGFLSKLQSHVMSQFRTGSHEGNKMVPKGGRKKKTPPKQ